MSVIFLLALWSNWGRGEVLFVPGAYPSRELCTQAGNMATAQEGGMFRDFQCVQAPPLATWSAPK